MKRGLEMTLMQAQAHAAKHGYSLDEDAGRVMTAGDKSKRTGEALRTPKSRMNKTETEFSLHLEAKKRKGEIIKWRFEAISLSWGTDPQTGKPMWYTPDFWVEDHFLNEFLLEIKGPHIREKDLIRFKGCRAEWGTRFTFELHQKKGGTWTRIH